MLKKILQAMKNVVDIDNCLGNPCKRRNNEINKSIK